MIGIIINNNLLKSKLGFIDFSEIFKPGAKYH